MYANKRDPRNDPANPVRRNAGRYERSDGLSGLNRYPPSDPSYANRHFESAGLGFVPPHTLGDDGMGFVPPHTLGLGPLAPFIAPVVSHVHVSFSTSAAKRAQNVIGRVIQSANAGNLNAVAIMDARRFIGIASERAVWANGFAQVSPQVLAVYAPHAIDLKSAIPESAEAGPEAAASWALRTPVTTPPSVLQQVADTVVPALLQTEAGQQVQQAAISAAVKDQAAQAGDMLKKYALPVGIGLALYLLSRLH